MQAITIAIGKTGIDFFAQHYLASAINQLLNNMAPPGRNIPIANFGWVESPDSQWGYKDISVELSNGKLQNFDSAFKSVVQGVTTDTPPVNIFTLGFQVSNFSANYAWTEDYNWDHQYYTWQGRLRFSHHKSGSTSTPLSYDPSIGGLVISVIIQFLYDSTTNAWQMTVKSTKAGKPTKVQSNIPANSILQHQVNSCAGQHVEDATAQMISAIDFETPINTLISGVINSIPGSGNLGNGIVYDFSVGDSGILFPNNDGIQMGVKGGASYNGTAYTGNTPPSLPLPTPPTDNDSHQLNMYVSNYEIDALNWGYFKAGKLNLLIKPSDIPDPKSLNVSNYTTFEPTLKPYAAFVMNAQIVQNTAPVTSFQTVYLFTTAVMNILQQQLPSNINQLIQALSGSVYVSKGSLEDFLNSATVPNNWFKPIEDASKIMAMVLTQDIEFTLLIQNGQPTPPDIKFQVQRVDVMTNLGLGINTNNNQTIQYGFANASNTPTFISSSIPGFSGSVFGTVVWPVTAEPLYEQVLNDLGKTGAPLPIMQGFQFDFENAQLSLQDGYISILSNVLYKNS